MEKSSSSACSEQEHDPSLIRWFSTLSPDQRLAELESRAAFFHDLKVSHDTELSRDSGSSHPT
jgi:hypothetical protein